MRTINLRLLAVLAILCLLTAAGVYWVHGFQVQRNAYVLFENAKAAKEAGKLDEAMRYLQRYLKRRPDDVDALAELGLLLADRSAFERAHATCEKVLRVEPGRADVRRKLVVVCIELGRYTDAKWHLEQYLLKTSPNDGELLELLGRCQSAVEEYAQAAESFRLATENAPARLEAYAARAQILRDHLHQPVKADQVMVGMVRANKDSCRAYVLLADHLRKIKKLDGATDQALRQVLESGPAGADASSATGQDWAEVVVKRALNLVPDDLGALLLASQCALDKEQYDQARQYASRVLEAHPQYVGTYLTLAEIEGRAGGAKEAIAWLEKGLEANPRQFELLWTKANLLLDGKEIEKARDTIAAVQELVLAQVYQPGADESKDPRPLLDYLKARLEFVQGHWLAASQGAKGPAELPGFEQTRARLAARPNLQKQVDFWLGTCYSELGNPDLALTAYRRAAESDPLWVPARVGSTAALYAMGRIAEALEEYRRIMRMDNAPADGWITVARLAILRNLGRNPGERDWQEAEQAIDLASLANPESVAAPILRAEVLVAQDRAQVAEDLLLARLSAARNLGRGQADRDWAEMERILDRLPQPIQDSVEGGILRAQAWVAQGRTQDAEALLKTRFARTDDLLKRIVSHASDPQKDSGNAQTQQVQLRAAVAALAQRQGAWDKAQQILDETKQAVGDSVPLRLARARYLVRRFGRQADKQLQELAENTKELPSADLPELWSGLAARSLQIGSFDLARRLCRQVSQLRPNDLQPCLLLFDLAVRAEDSSDVDKLLQGIQRIEGTGPLYHYGRALQLTLEAKPGQAELLDQAQRHLAAAAAVRPAWSRVPLLAAEVCERQGKEDLAITNYLAAIELGERSPRAVRQAIELLYQRRRYTEADQVVRRLEEQQAPFSADLGRVASAVSLQLEDFDRALEIARQSAGQSEDYRDHVWLGHVLDILGQRAKVEGRIPESQQMLAEAEAELRRAVELPGEATNASVALVQFLARTGQTQRGQEAVAEAEKKGLSPLVLGQCYEALAQLDQAEKKYQEALAAAPNDPTSLRHLASFYLRTGKPQLAEVQLQAIAQAAAKVENTDTLWGRRNLARILASRGGFQNLLRGLDLIDKNLAADAQSVEDKRLKAALLARHPKREKRREAIRILEELPQQQVLAEDRFRLWEFYQREGEWSSATRHMRILLAAHTDDQQYALYVAAYTSALLARRETSEARLWLSQLEKLAAGRFSTVQLQARTLVQGGQYDAAVKRLKDFVENPNSQLTDRMLRLGLAASTLADLGAELRDPALKPTASRLAGEAEAMYRQCVEQHPGQGLVLAAFLGKQGRLDEAVKLAAQSWQDAKPETVAATMPLLLRAAIARGDQEVGRVEALLLAALEKHNRPIPLLLLLADLRSTAKHFDEAEAIYREILDQDINHLLALNNLAALLASQGKKLEEARRLIDRAVALAGPDPTLLDSRAAVLLAMGKPEEASREVTQALAEAPSAVLRFRQAQVFEALGQKSAAKQVLAKAQELGLKAELLHPLDRPAYGKLQAALSRTQ